MNNISKYKCYIIAEIGINHNGSLSMCKKDDGNCQNFWI